jgi:hypothetical protein
MSPPSRGRKRKKPATRARRQPPPGPEMMVARIAQDAFGVLEGTTDALDAELFVSELLGSWWGLPVEVDPEAELGERLVA